MEENHKNTPFNSTNGENDSEELNQVWNLAESAYPQTEISAKHVEEALQKVHSRIDVSDPDYSSNHTTSQERYWLYARYLVAAAALITFGLYFLFTPIHISVPYGEMATIELSDGSEVELNSGSELTYSRFFGRANRDLTLNGEAYFSVKPAAAPFRVKSNGTVTEVLGTQFNIRSWRDDPNSETVLTVTEGKVDFFTERSEHQKVTLTAGKLSRWNFEMETPIVEEPLNISDRIGWKENRLIFKEQSLIVILHELERRFNTRISLEVPGAGLDTLTAYYSEPKSVTAVLDDISTVKGFRFAETANGYRIYK
jgi:transmembrane sensor